MVSEIARSHDDMNVTAQLLRDGETFLSDGDPNRAAICFTKARELDEDTSPLPLLGLARVALMSGQRQEAARLADAAIGIQAKSPEALTVKALTEEAAGRVDAARALLEKALQFDSSYAVAHFNLGRLLAQRKEWRRAYDELRQSLVSTPLDSGATVLAATAAFRCGEVHDATLLLCTHLVKRPNDVDAIVTLSDILLEVAQVEAAHDLLKNACERLRTSPVLLGRYAVCAMIQRDLPTARAAVKRQLDLTPDDVEASFFAASLDILALDFVAAEAKVEAVLLQNRENWRGHCLLGVIFESLRCREAAMVAYAKSASLNPKAWEPRNNLAILLLEDGEDIPRALRLLTEVMTFANPPVEAKFNLMLAHWKSGAFAKAEEVAARIVAEHPNSPLAAKAVELARSTGRDAPRGFARA